MMDRSIVGIRRPDDAHQLERTGYLRTEVVLSADECAHLSDVFHEAMRRTGRPIGEQWFPTILFPEDDIRAFISREASATVLPRLADVIDLEVLEPVRIDYSVKPVGPDSALGPHQDFSIVDESRWTSLYLWIPLVDSNQSNGTLHVLPGSHRFTNPVRARHVPALFDQVLDEVRRRAVRLDCKAGEVVLMVSGVVHFSPPNTSDRLRLATHGILKPIEAPVIFYYADDRTPPGLVEMYEVGIDDYVHLALDERPSAALTISGYCPRPPTEMTPERFAVGLRDVEM